MKNTYKVFTLMVVWFFAMAIFVPDGCKTAQVQTAEPDLVLTSIPAAGVAFSSTVPADVANGYDATAEELAIFAWQEFIALNWPAKPNPNPTPGMSAYFRGQASSDNLGTTGSGGVVVWETFQHRVELYPGYPSGQTFTLPDINAIPDYQYPFYKTIIKPAGVDTTLFNNLDEASEISLADMYFTPFAEQVDALRQQYGMMPTTEQTKEIDAAGIKAGIVYEAKGNPVIYNYIKANGYNNSAARNAAARNTVFKINNQPDSIKGATFEFPAGSIEMKATWRRYDSSMDNLNDYHWTKGIYYTGDPQNSGTVTTAQNDTFLLIGLHIIQKTPSIPSFTFATFEHVTNEQYGFRFKNTHPEDVTTYARPLPDAGIRKAIRQFPIPPALDTLNVSIQQQLRSDFGADIVWANYQLIGIQAKIQDDPGGPVPDQEFFLSNFATETNDALQFFQGGLSGTYSNVPNPDVKAVHVPDMQTGVYTAFSAGGCAGCHGAQGQDGGFDFSVIAAKGNSFGPEPVEEYPIGAVSDQNPALYPLPHGQ